MGFIAVASRASCQIKRVEAAACTIDASAEESQSRMDANVPHEHSDGRHESQDRQPRTHSFVTLLQLQRTRELAEVEGAADHLVEVVVGADGLAATERSCCSRHSRGRP